MEQKTEEEEEESRKDVEMESMGIESIFSPVRSLLHQQVEVKALFPVVSAETPWLCRNLYNKYKNNKIHGSCCTEFTFVSTNVKEASSAQILLFN